MKRGGQREDRAERRLPGRRKDDVVKPGLCQQDEPFTVAANELDPWPRPGRGPGAASATA